jgi:hypothetical protein
MASIAGNIAQVEPLRYFRKPDKTASTASARAARRMLRHTPATTA